MIPAAIERGVFTPEKQIEITTVFAVTGDVKQTSEITKVDPKHVRNFLRTEEFRALFEEFRTENAAKFEAKFAEALEHVQDELLNRIRHGDVVLDREGNPVRVPVKARDLGSIANTMFDKLQLLRGKPTSRTESTSADGKLELLAQKFIELAGKASKKRPPETIEVIPETVRE